MIAFFRHVHGLSFLQRVTGVQDDLLARVKPAEDFNVGAVVAANHDRLEVPLAISAYDDGSRTLRAE